MTINRREMLTGAAALFGSAYLPYAIGAVPGEAANSGPTALPEKPTNLFASTFTEGVLSRSLVAASDWHPYPKASEREAWQKVHAQVGQAAVARAEKINGTPWEALPATLFLEYKRTGNRSHFEHFYFTRRM